MTLKAITHHDIRVIASGDENAILAHDRFDDIHDINFV